MKSGAIKWKFSGFHCVHVGVTVCVFWTLFSSLHVCPSANQIWAYGWSQWQFNQSLVILLIPDSPTANNSGKKKKNETGLREEIIRKRTKENSEWHRRTLKFLGGDVTPQEVTFTGQRTKRWPHQKGTRVDSEKGLSVIWGLYLDLLWRPWLNHYGPCTCMTGDKKDDASALSAHSPRSDSYSSRRRSASWVEVHSLPSHILHC